MTRTKFHIDIPESIQKIHQVFSSNGFELSLVGGAVRDAYLGITPKDYDLATNATPDQVIEILENQPFVDTIITTGKSFAVVNVIVDGEEFELATYRRDIGSTDGRRPDSVEFTTMEGDAARRDLTLNALFYDLSTGEIIDFVGGLNDLATKTIRTVGKAFDRFEEDKLRILRAIRFAARFGANLSTDIKNELYHADLSNISKERIRDEFLKGIKSSKTPYLFFRYLDLYKLFPIVFEGIIDENQTVIYPRYSRNPLIQIARGLFFQNPTHKQLNELKYTDKEIKNILFLIDLGRNLSVNTMYRLKKKQNQLGITKEFLKEYFRENRTSTVNNLFLEFELSVKAIDVIQEFNVEGRALGEKIEELETQKFKNLLEKYAYIF
jgi:tRNA nucleotidyltransferase/poly(A) polymerase